MKISMILVLLLVLIFGFGFATNAQELRLSGKAFDENGAVIPGIKIVARNKKNEIFETTTNTEGIYSLKLPNDMYLIELSHVSGWFCPIRIKNYKVVEAMSFDFVFEVRAKNTNCKSKTIKF